MKVGSISAGLSSPLYVSSPEESLEKERGLLSGTAYDKRKDWSAGADLGGFPLKLEPLRSKKLWNINKNDILA